MGQVILYASLGALTSALLLPLLFFGLKRRVTYTALTIDDLIDYFQQINQEVLLEIDAQDSEPLEGEAPAISMPHRERSLFARLVLKRVNHSSYSHRRHLRLKLDLLREYTQRMLHNAARPGHVAYSDLCKMRKHRLHYQLGELDAIYQLLYADEAFRKFGRSVLRKTWFWSVIRFEERTWGPVPDFAAFQISQMIAAYNQVKRATEAYARFYGDVGRLISEEIRAKM